MKRFKNRQAAGRKLAAALSAYGGRDDIVILALPRGGVPVAAELAAALGAALDILVVRKLGAPGQEELALGGVATGGVRVLNEDIVRQLRVTGDALQAITERELKEIERREHRYRGERDKLELHGRTLILVDDGVATGATMRAGLQALRSFEPRHLVAAVPVGPVETCRDLERYADEVICLHRPYPFRAVGLWYDDFHQLTDDEVRALLEHHPTA